MLAYHANLSLAQTYALRRPKLAKECASAALQAAIEAKRPDLAYQASMLLSAI